ncbi:hypothetical protein MMC28_009898 [Mycoblastus sanguinarius]|nr:hypothetical protein [Mycoblastus sanguinarius]
MDPKTVCYPESYEVINVYGFCNIVTDFMLLLMPMPLVAGLQMARTKKIGVALVFATGALICAIAIVRQYILLATSQTTDPSWQIIASKIWMSIEVNLAIICGCLPVLQPLFRKTSFLARFLLSSIRSKFSNHSAKENAPWPAQLSGPRHDVEKGPQQVKRAPWREPDEESEESESVGDMYHHEGVLWHP